MIYPPINHPDRRIGIALRLHTGLKTGHAPLAIIKGEIGIPAQTEVEGQSLIDSPVVLSKKAPFSPAQIFVFPTSLSKSRGLTQQKVCQPFPCMMPVKDEITVLQNSKAGL